MNERKQVKGGNALGPYLALSSNQSLAGGLQEHLRNLEREHSGREERRLEKREEKQWS